MSTKRFLKSVVLQLERASSKPSPRYVSLITSSRISPRAATLSLPSRQYPRQLRTTGRLRFQEAPPPSKTTTTTANTSPQDPNKATSAETATTSPNTTSPSSESKIYTYDQILAHTRSPTTHPHRILIDVREPSELAATGHIPTALNVPITTQPDAFFLPELEFEERFGFPRPGQDNEVVFYCKSGVRSRAAARLAVEARPRFGGRVGEFPGSWGEWEKRRGGGVEKV